MIINSNPSTTLEELHKNVRLLSSLGFHIFPLLPGKKIPATTGGFKAAVSNPDEAVQLFSRADLNIGIATGASNLVVLDIDGPEGRNSFREIFKGQLIPSTFMVLTRRGVHAYFRQPGDQRIGCSAGKIGVGIDIRGDGGYVVGPTSWVDADEKGPAARYRTFDDSPVVELPDWLLEVIKTNTKGELKKRRLPNELIHRLPDTPKQRAILSELLSSISSHCNYEKWRDIVWAILSTGWTDAEEIARRWSQTALDKYDEYAFDILISSYDDTRFSAKTLYVLQRYKGGAK